MHQYYRVLPTSKILEIQLLSQYFNCVNQATTPKVIRENNDNFRYFP
jgi:hypothetical protein